jgi:hypothetical protein
MRNIPGKVWCETDKPKQVKLEASWSQRLPDAPLSTPSDRTVINECLEANKPRNWHGNEMKHELIPKLTITLLDYNF